MPVKTEIQQSPGGDKGSDYEKLFLLEILVVNVYIKDSSLELDEEVISNLRETCVLFQFLNYPPLVVCEEDFCQYNPKLSSPDTRLIFKCGKSCLFSLRSLKCPVLPMDFDINISVAKKLREGLLPNKLVIGKTNINMGGSFTRLMSENTDKSCADLPTPKITRDTFDLFDDKGKNVGDITVFIRLSCFGKLIVTQFQLGADQKKFLFKGTDNRAKTLEMKQNEVNVKKEQQINEMGLSNESPILPCNQYGDQTNPMMQQVPTNMYGDQKPPEYNQANYPLGDYNPRNDNRGPIKTERDEVMEDSRWQRKQERKPYYKDKAQDYSMRYGDRERSRMPSKQAPPLCPYAPKLNVCDCAYPIPSEILPRCPASQNPRRKKQSKMSVSESNNNFELPPGGVGVSGDQVIFQMPKPGETVSERDKKMASQLLYKVGAVEGGKESPKQIVQILPQPPSEIPSPTDKEDVFILKIGKKVEGVEGKTNFEVELRTPKMKEPKPETNTQETQYAITDIDGGKKKGKGGKGGKGKKDKGGKRKGKKK